MTIGTLAPGETQIWRVVQVVRQLVQLLQGSWVAYTATVTPNSGALTQTGTAAYLQVGKIVYISIDVTITITSGAPASITIALPVAAKRNANLIGIERAVNFDVLRCNVPANALTSGTFRKYDGTVRAPTTAEEYTFNAVYEAA